MISERKRLSFNIKSINKPKEQENKQEQIDSLKSKITFKNPLLLTQKKLSQVKLKQTRNFNTSLILPRITSQHPITLIKKERKKKIKNEKKIKVINDLSFLAINLSNSTSNVSLMGSVNQLKIKNLRNDLNKKEMSKKPIYIEQKDVKCVKFTRKLSVNNLDINKYNDLTFNFQRSIEQSLLRCENIKCEINKLLRNCFYYIDSQRI